MADWFKARFLAKRNEKDVESFQSLVDTIQAAIDDGDYASQSAQVCAWSEPSESATKRSAL